MQLTAQDWERLLNVLDIEEQTDFDHLYLKKASLSMSEELQDMKTRLDNRESTRFSNQESNENLLWKNQKMTSIYGL